MNSIQISSEDNKEIIKTMHEYNLYIIFMNINLNNKDWDSIYLEKELFLKICYNKLEEVISNSKKYK